MKMAIRADSDSAIKRPDEIIGEYSQTFICICPPVAGSLARGLRRAIVLSGQL
jgi:hypothetical protein